MTGRRCILRLLALPLLLFVATIGPSSSEADEAALLVGSREILSVAPMIDKRSLIGRTVWVGDNRGFRGAATVEPNPHFAHEAFLDQDFGVELGLAFTGPAAFEEIGAKKLAPGAISKLVLMRAKELGAV